ncbi:MAG: InlB B-repeat-containing protein [Ruminococcus sp.]|nr:InlB B-repeat-containing protein [Ruminococcus sp.]
MRKTKKIMVYLMTMIMTISMLSGLSASANNTVNNILISGQENGVISGGSHSETSYIDFTFNSDYKFNGHNTLKIDYTVNQNDSYNGYAGYELSAGKTVSTNGATGIGFWYATPKDQKGTVALCVQGSVAKKLVKLSATNGLWQYCYLPASFNNSTISNIEIYINGNEQGKVTTPSSGTIYIADLAVTNIVNESNETYTFESMTEGNGIISGTENGIYSKGTIISLTAIPNDGYKLLGWIKNNKIINEGSTYTFAIDSDTQVKAVFGNSIAPYHSVAAYAGVGGKVLNGEARFCPAGAGISITAVADEGYTFVGWSLTEDGDIEFTGRNFISKLTRDLTLYAQFKPKAK